MSRPDRAGMLDRAHEALSVRRQCVLLGLVRSGVYRARAAANDDGEAGLMRRLEQRLEALATSHGAVLATHAGATIRAGGKRLRPLLVFLAAGQRADENDGVLRAAVAVELIHSATLVHDDVLDAAPLRRGLAFAYPHDGGDFTNAVHRCTGVGKCRADLTGSGGVMCPSYLATRDEKDSTRGRARVLQEMQIGTGRMDALRGLGERTDVGDLQSFVAAMVQADSYGVPIANVLRVQSDEIRLKRSQRAEEAAQKVPVKILFPLIFGVMPALFVVIIGPAAVQAFYSFRGLV